MCKIVRHENFLLYNIMKSTEIKVTIISLFYFIFSKYSYEIRTL